MMSFASSCTCCILSPRSLSAAFCITPGSVEMPTVKLEGTSTRMFCFDSALRRSTLMEIGVRSMYWYDWIIGTMNAAPPCMQRALRA